jgi:uncharacterized protein YbgA (DUF1722 family)/uncharacterized protein YbbK (DUF523 family)
MSGRRGAARAAAVHPTKDEIRIGISSCLLGQHVRYDGGHKEDAFATGLLARFVTFVPVCPEVELGLGTPRETIRLQRDGDVVRLVAPGSGKDHTAAMRRLAEVRVAELARLDLSGFILKKDSPSCGMERVRVWGGGAPARVGRGAFATVLLERFPLLPVEEEGRLHDLAHRENWVERVFAYRRVRALFAGRWALAALVAFHAAEKLLLLAHDPEAHRRLGTLVASASGTQRHELARAYAEIYMGALRRPATRGRHANVLQHMARHFKELIGASERSELQEAIADYRHGLVPLVVPVTLVRHHVRRHGIAYLASQRYLEPHPTELMLRNHV